MQTARQWGKPPSCLITGGTEWTARDRILALGHQLYEAALCPECGRPKRVCRDPGMSGRFTIHSEICQATAALQQHRSEPGYQPTPGELLYAVPEDTGDGDTDDDDQRYGGPPPGLFDD